MDRIGRPRNPKRYTGVHKVNENWSEYLLRVGAQEAIDSPNTERAKEFRKYANRIARQVNKQLRELNKAHMTHFGYESVQAFTKANYGTTRFKLLNANSKLTAHQLYKQTLMGQRFLNFATATVEGYQEQLDIRKEAMRRIANKAGIEPTEKELTNVMWLLSDKEIRKTIIGNPEISSETFVEMLYGAYSETTVKDIKEAFYSYQEALRTVGTPDYEEYTMKDLKDELDRLADVRTEMLKRALKKH